MKTANKMNPYVYGFLMMVGGVITFIIGLIAVISAK